MSFDPHSSVVIGVDGARAGWCVAQAAPEQSKPDLHFVQDIEAFLIETEWSAVAIDMPIGLSNGPSRRCDLLARERLGKRRSTLFFAPILSAMECDHYSKANAQTRATTGKGLSVQSFMLAPKIRTIRQMLLDHPDWKNAVFESHPELGFLLLAQGEAIPSKHTPEGIAARRNLLGADHTIFPKSAKTDDWLDAWACWKSACRAQSGEIIWLPEEMEFDATNLPMRIGY